MAADLTWPADRMSKFIDVTPRRLAQLVQEGVVERAERGRYNPFVVTVAYIRWLRDQRSHEGNSDAEVAAQAGREARRRKNMAEAEKAEMETALKKGEIRRGFERTVADVAIRVRRIFENADYLNADQRKKLSKELGAMEVPPPLI